MENLVLATHNKGKIAEMWRNLRDKGHVEKVLEAARNDG